MRKLLPLIMLLAVTCNIIPPNPTDPTNPDYVKPYLIFDSTGVHSGDTISAGAVSITLRGNLSDKNQYRYRLDSLTWSPWQATRSAGTIRITLADADTGIHTLRIQTCYDPSGDIMDTAVVFVKVDPPRVVSVSDTAVYAATGQMLRMWVKLSGTNPINHQWYFNGVPKAGASKDTLVLDSVRLLDQGPYFCIVSNRWGADTSGEIRLSVIDTAHSPICPKPAIDLTIRRGDTLRIGHSYFLAIKASGEGVLQYQWYLNGVTRQNQTTDTIRLLTFGSADTGVYFCIVKNGCGTPDTSNKVHLALSDTAHIKSVATPFDSLSPPNNAIDIDYLNNVVLSWKGGNSTDGASVSYIVKYGKDTVSLQDISTVQKQITIIGVEPNMRYFWCVIALIGLDTAASTPSVGKFNTFKTKSAPILSFNNISDRQVITGDTLHFVPVCISTDSAKPVITVNLSGLPVGNTANYNVATNTLNWIPADKDTGRYNIIFVATSKGATVADTMKLTVTKQLKDPVILVTADTTIKEGQLLSLPVRVQDPIATNNDIVATVKPSGSTFGVVNGQSVFAWQPDYSAASYSPYNVTFQVPGVVYFVTKTIRINVQDVKYHILITQLAKNGTISFTPSGTSAFEPGQTCQLSVAVTNDSCFFDQWTGDLSGNVNPRTITVNGDLNISAKISYKPVAENPIFAPTTGSQLNFVSVTLSTATQGATIYYTLDGSNPIVGASATKAYNGGFILNQSVTVKAITICMGYIPSSIVSQTYFINHAPTFKDSLLPEHVFINDQYTAVLPAVDADGDPIRFSKVSGPACLTVDSISGTVKFFAARSCVQPGTYTIIVSISDGKGGSAQKTWLVQVFDNALPTISVAMPVDSSSFGYTMPMDTSVNVEFDATAIDPDGRIDSVQFFINDSLVVTKSIPPGSSAFSYIQTFKAIPKGTYWYAIKFRSFDNRQEYTDKIIHIKLIIGCYRC